MMEHLDTGISSDTEDASLASSSVSRLRLVTPWLRLSGVPPTPAAPAPPLGLGPSRPNIPGLVSWGEDDIKCHRYCINHSSKLLPYLHVEWWGSVPLLLVLAPLLRRPQHGDTAGGHQEEDGDHGEDDEDDEGGLAKLDQEVDVILVACILMK